MKKIFFLCVFCSLFTLLLSINTKAYSEDNFEHKSDIYENVNNESKLENKIEPIVLIEPMFIGCAKEDKYEDISFFENNNYISNAVKISKGSTIYATLHKHPWWCGGEKDVDYYYFNLDRKSTIRVELSNIPSGNDYDLELYNEKHNFIRGSYRAGNNSENIEITLNPGTYYIHIYSYSGYSDTSQYKLSTSYTTIYPEGITLTSSIKQTYKAVLWESQYFPMGKHPVIYNNEVIYQVVCSHSGCSSTPKLHLLEELGIEDEYISRILFVWDKDEKVKLAQDLKKLVLELKVVDDNDNIQLGVSIVGVGVTVVSISTPGGGGAIIKTVSLTSALLGLLISDSDMTKAINYKVWFAYLAGALEHSPDGEVIKITEHYKLEGRSLTPPGTYAGGMSYTIKYFIKPDERLNSPVYTSSYISWLQSGNPFIGNLTLLESNVDIYNIFKYV